MALHQLHWGAIPAFDDEDVESDEAAVSDDEGFNVSCISLYCCVAIKYRTLVIYTTIPYFMYGTSPSFYCYAIAFRALVRIAECYADLNRVVHFVGT